jgi:DNA-binding NtrC family response regulator
MQKENDRLIIAVSNHNYSDYTTISNILGLKEEQLLFYYTDGNESKSSLDGNFSYNFAFIDQRGKCNGKYSNLADKIEEVINETQASSIRIAVHKTGGPVSKVEKGISLSCDDKKVISVREFIHETVCEIWEEGLNPFIKNSIGGGFDSYDEYYETLWKLLASKPSEETQPTIKEITDEKLLKNLAVKKVVSFKHIGKNIHTAMLINAKDAKASMQSQPEEYPESLNGFKKETFKTWLKDYEELLPELKVLKISENEDIIKILKNTIGCVEIINRKTLPLVHSVKKAFEVTDKIKEVCDLLSKLIRSNQLKKVLFIDDQLYVWGEIMKKGLSEFDFKVIEESDPLKTISMIKEHDPDAIMLDVMFGGNNIGKSTLEKIKGNKLYANIPVMMLTDTEADDDYNPNDYVLASGTHSKCLLDELNGFKYLANKLNQIIEEAIVNDNLTPLDSGDFIIGSTAKMKEIYKIISKIATTDETVLITGENGTGKQVLAEEIHKQSLKNDIDSFKTVDCTNLPKNFPESELFGVIANYPGLQNRVALTGKFQQADGGTIFIDEIGELPIESQPTLLRAIQEKQVRRLGEVNYVNISVRIIAATNKNLKDEIKQGKFRKDLYFRLNFIHIALPALRERKEDLKILYKHCVKKYSDKYGKSIVSNKIRVDVLKKFNSYEWPGNIREFDKAIGRAIALTSDTVLRLDDFKGLEGGHENNDNNILDVNKTVQEILEEKHSWDGLGLGSGNPLSGPILRGVVDTWILNTGKRPKHLELAKLFKIKYDNMRKKFDECGLPSLTEGW